MKTFLILMIGFILIGCSDSPQFNKVDEELRTLREKIYDLNNKVDRLVFYIDRRDRIEEECKYLASLAFPKMKVFVEFGSFGESVCVLENDSADGIVKYPPRELKQKLIDSGKFKETLQRVKEEK